MKAFIFLFMCVGAWAAATNTLTIANNRGATQVDVPIGGIDGTIMGHFADGEIPPGMCPQVRLDNVPVATQADVKQRYASGSPKQAVIATLFGSVTSSNHTVSFQSQACNNTPLTQAQMLNDFDFGATITITYSGGTATADARAMLMAGDCTPWTSGQIAQTMICGVHTQTLMCNNVPCSKWDIGTDAYHSLRPLFNITFWPARNHSYFIEYVMENGQSETIQDQTYSVALTHGSAAPTQWYTHASFTHWGVTRWGKRKWVGGDPPLDNWVIDHNLAWLESLHVVPPYDLVIPSANWLTNMYNQWKSTKKDIQDGGLWDRSMGQGGGAQPQIGPIPEWYLMWLYTGDPRAMEMSLSQADLAMAWQTHYREGKVNKIMNPGDTGSSGLGHVVSGYGRPYFTSVNWPGVCPNICGSDKIMQVGPLTIFNVGYDAANNPNYNNPGNGWLFDPAHEPSAFAVPYLLTGDYMYLEEQWFWSGNSIAKQYVWSSGRKVNPTVLSCNNNLARALAWDLRDRADTAMMSPDGTPEKTYFMHAIDDCLAVEEGVRKITTSPYNNNPAWQHGRNSVSHYYSTGFPYYRGDIETWSNGVAPYDPPPLHQLSAGAPLYTACSYQALNCQPIPGTVSVTNGVNITFSDVAACNAMPVGTLLGPVGWDSKSLLLSKTCPTAKVQEGTTNGPNQAWETTGDTLFANGGFMELYAWGSLGRVKEQGFPAGPLYSWASYYYLNVMAATEGINPYAVGAGRVPVTSAHTKGAFIPTFTELKTHFKPGMNYSNSVSQGPDGYFAYVRYGLAYASGEPLYTPAVNWYKTNVAPLISWTSNLKWALVNPSGTAPPTPTTYSITGTITPAAGGSGAAISLSGPATATTVGDSAGNYGFAGLLDGAYTVTPALTGFTYMPAAASVTIAGANQVASFTATATITPPTTNFCDVNQDGVVNALDAAAQLNWSSGISQPPQGRSADRNGDGKVDLIDAKLVMDAVAGGMCAATQ